MNRILNQIKEQVDKRLIRFTLHAHQKMALENVKVSDLVNALSNTQLLENYSEYERGPCCLVCGKTKTGRQIHIVCTATQPELVIITIYEPTLPKWITPYQRRPAT